MRGAGVVQLLLGGQNVGALPQRRLVPGQLTLGREHIRARSRAGIEHADGQIEILLIVGE